MTNRAYSSLNVNNRNGRRLYLVPVSMDDALLAQAGITDYQRLDDGAKLNDQLHVLTNEYPDRELVLCVDNDMHDARLGNTSILGAFIAAREFNLSVTWPKFERLKPYKTLLDPAGLVYSGHNTFSTTESVAKPGSVYAVASGDKLQLINPDGKPIYIDSRPVYVNSNNEVVDSDNKAINCKSGQLKYISSSPSTWADLATQFGTLIVSSHLTGAISLPVNTLEFYQSLIKYTGYGNVSDIVDKCLAACTDEGIDHTLSIDSIFSAVEERFGREYCQAIMGQLSDYNSVSKDDNYKSTSLEIAKYRNKSGQINSFIVTAKQQDIREYESLIKNAVSDQVPLYYNAKFNGFTLPLHLLGEVSSKLSSVTGFPPLHFQTRIDKKNNPMLVIKGCFDNLKLASHRAMEACSISLPYSESVDGLLTSLSNKFELRAALTDLLTGRNINHVPIVDYNDEPTLGSFASDDRDATNQPNSNSSLSTIDSMDMDRALSSYRSSPATREKCHKLQQLD